MAPLTVTHGARRRGRFYYWSEADPALNDWRIRGEYLLRPQGLTIESLTIEPDRQTDDETVPQEPASGRGVASDQIRAIRVDELRTLIAREIDRGRAKALALLKEAEGGVTSEERRLLLRLAAGENVESTLGRGQDHLRRVAEAYLLEATRGAGVYARMSDHAELRLQSGEKPSIETLRHHVKKARKNGWLHPAVGSPGTRETTAGPRLLAWLAANAKESEQ